MRRFSIARSAGRARGKSKSADMDWRSRGFRTSDLADLFTLATEADALSRRRAVGSMAHDKSDQQLRSLYPPMSYPQQHGGYVDGPHHDPYASNERFVPPEQYDSQPYEMDPAPHEYPPTRANDYHDSPDDWSYGEKAMNPVTRGSIAAQVRALFHLATRSRRADGRRRPDSEEGGSEDVAVGRACRRADEGRPWTLLWARVLLQHHPGHCIARGHHRCLLPCVLPSRCTTAPLTAPCQCGFVLRASTSTASNRRRTGARWQCSRAGSCSTSISTCVPCASRSR